MTHQHPSGIEACRIDTDKATPTKLVRVRLAAVVRMEFTEIARVPRDITSEELAKMVDERYEKVDGGEYSMDPAYWRREQCFAAEVASQGGQASIQAQRDASGNLVIEDVGQVESAEAPGVPLGS